MIDFRHKTFLEVCRLKSLTKAGDSLCITQPAVSQHIQYLESLYGVDLITFNKRKFGITERGQILFNYLSTLEVDSQIVINNIQNVQDNTTRLSFGATLSIGEYVMPPILKKLIEKNPLMNLRMFVDNTQVLLKKLEDGEINFALIEGTFNKDRYDSLVFSLEEFIAVSSPLINLNKVCRLESLCENRLLTREIGSGSRMILEQILLENNLQIEHFSNIIELGNIHAIKELAKNGFGIAFVYKAAVFLELQNKTLKEIKIKNFNHKREFSFVYLKESHFTNDYKEIFKILKMYHKECFLNTQ